METFEKRFLYAPIVKERNSGKYFCVLTDNGIDREDEIVGKTMMDKAASEEWLPAHMNHEYKVENLVAEWVNKRVEKVDGKSALVAEPKWFMSNPHAQMIKNMLDDGAKIGLSIVAIPSKYEDKEINGKTYKMWTDGEIVSTDFVTIPANKGASAMKIAKSLFKIDEVDTMNEEEKASMMKSLSEEISKSIAEGLAKIDVSKAVQEELKKVKDAEEAEKIAKAEAEKKLAEEKEKAEIEAKKAAVDDEESEESDDEKKKGCGKKKEAREEALKSLNAGLPKSTVITEEKSMIVNAQAFIPKKQ